MGNYIFGDRGPLYRGSSGMPPRELSHDFGRDIIPACSPCPRLCLRLQHQRDPGRETNVYWRDVGTLDSYWQAHMDLVADDAPLSTIASGRCIPITRPCPATFIDTDDCKVKIANSLISGGCFIQGSQIQQSILVRCNIGPAATSVNPCCWGCEIGEGCSIRRAIIDKTLKLHPAP